VVSARTLRRTSSEPSAAWKAGGAFRLEGLVPGTYELEVSTYEGRGHGGRCASATRSHRLVIEMGEQNVVTGVVLGPARPARRRAASS
jgi:hypothetical protein